MIRGGVIFAADPGVIGRVVRNDRQRTVIGVMPRGFAFPDQHTQFRIPYVPPAPNSRLFISPAVVARLANGVSIPQAQSELDAVSGQSSIPERYELVGLQDESVTSVRPALRMIAVAVAFVLLIASVNVANLMLARSETRQRELAVRVAIGASRGRLLRQSLAESVLLSFLGAAVGIAVAAGGVKLLQILGTNLARRDLGAGVSIPRLEEVGIDPLVLGFALTIALLTSVVFGVTPGMHSSTALPQASLRASIRTTRFRRILVIAAVALAVMLLIGGGLVLHSFVRLASVDPGYNPSHVLTFRVNPSVPPPQRRAFADDLVARFSRLPGIVAAAYGNNIPLVQQGLSRTVSARPVVLENVFRGHSLVCTP